MDQKAWAKLTPRWDWVSKPKKGKSCTALRPVTPRITRAVRATMREYGIAGGRARRTSGISNSQDNRMISGAPVNIWQVLARAAARIQRPPFSAALGTSQAIQGSQARVAA